MSSLVQTKGSKAASATSLAATLSAGTTAGNTVVAYVGYNVQTGTITGPAGWSQVGSTVQVSGSKATSAMFYLSNVAAGQTSWTWTFGAAGNVTIILEEWSGALTLDVTASNTFSTPTATPTTGTTAAPAAAGELGLWMLQYNNASVLTYSSILNSYVENTTAGTVTQGGTSPIVNLVAFNNTNCTSSAQSSGVTLSATPSGAEALIIAVFKPASSGTAWNQSLSDAHSATDADSLFTTKLLLDATSGQDTRQLQTTHLVQDLFSETDSFSRTWAANLTLLAAHSGLDTLAKVPAKAFIDRFSEIDAFSKTYTPGSGTAWTRNLSDAHSALDVLVRLPTKFLVDNFSEIDLFTRTWTAHLTLQDWVSELESLAKNQSKSVLDNTSAQDAIIKGEGKTLGDTLSGTDQLGPKGIGKGLTDVTSGMDSPAKSLTRHLFDQFSETDQLTISRLLLLKLLDSVSLTDHITANFQKAVVQGALSAVASSLAAVLQSQVSFGSTALSSSLSTLSGSLSNTPGHL